MSKNIAVAARLREERERLLLNQGLFAGKVGVSRMSQVNYESGKRSPDADYLQAAFEAGVDIGYVITGKRTDAPDFFRMATIFLLESVSLRTGFSEDLLRFVIELVADAASSGWLADKDELQSMPDVPWDMTQWIVIGDLDELVAALYENGRLLRDIFGTLNNIVATNGPVRLTGAKRLAMVLMLFRAFRMAGEVDRKVVEDTLRLVAT